jgi:hypothetical protein
MCALPSRSPRTPSPARPPASASRPPAIRVDVDLDMDSNNDGLIDPDNSSSGTDDGIENACPGKWTWPNNDDSDSDQACDNADGIIHGATDLAEDISPLVVLPCGLILPGWHVYLQTSDPTIVRVFGERTAGVSAFLTRC